MGDYVMRIDEIIENKLYLSGYKPVQDEEKLDQHGITHVLTLGDLPEELPSGARRATKRISIVDSKHADISSVLQEAVDFIGQGVDGGGKVLVHCKVGQSRSVSCVIAYLMATTEGLNFDDAIALVRTKRSIANPNVTFIS